MKIDKLKLLSIAFSYLVAALWSETQCMDNQTDILDSATFNRTAHMQSTTQNEIDSLDFEPKPTGSINMENSQSSWVPYLISPVKTTLQMASEFISFAHNHPNKAMFIGLVFTYQVASAAAVVCSCTCYGGANDRASQSFIVKNETDCLESCKGTGDKFWNCLQAYKIQ